MIKVYANLVYHGVKKLEDVPEKLRMAVEAEVERMKKLNV
jgi:hypothetical protein